MSAGTVRTVSMPVSDILVRVAREMVTGSKEHEDLLAVVLADIAEALPDLAADARTRELVAATVRDTILAAVTVFSTGVPLTSVRTPETGLELARRLAQRNVPIAAMLRAYRLGQARVQQELITRIAARKASADEVAEAAKDLSSSAFGFVDLVAEEVVAAYQAERDDWMRQRNAARLAKINSVLEARSGELDDAETALGYELARSGHLAAVFWCEVDGASRLTALERRMPRLAAAVGAVRTPLVIAPDAATLWVWFPVGASPNAVTATVTETVTETVTVAVTEALAAVPDVYAAFGDPASGVDGFRHSHQQARQAQALAHAADPRARLRVTVPALLGPIALLALEPGSAAGWVWSVLGELAVDDDAHARMRETLWAYLSSGSSLATAAAELHLHKNTIQYRVRKAEEARGRPLADGRLDVEVALLACRLLGSTVLRPPSAGGGNH
ncbi:PucR family transcriptional regulator [Pseudonocardia sp. Cha107L01]|uniref:PucR family transcriptional regulator n=1 Tax=Pseudonocardia sp. Cha107L01 TaxID=3457576 RepID=UPI00403EB3D4